MNEALDMVNICHYPTHLYFLLLFLPSYASAPEAVSVVTEWSPLQFPLPDVVITSDAMPHHWAFFYSGFRSSCFMLWHLVWFYVQGAYCFAKAPGCGTHAV